MGTTPEEIRLRYLYRTVILRGKVRLPIEDAKKLVGPDCAYHLYSTRVGPSEDVPAQAPSCSGDAAVALYNIPMRPEERRRQGTSRVIRLHAPADPELDMLSESTPQARMEALWDLTLEYLTWTRPDDRESRLQRSVCRVERRGS